MFKSAINTVFITHYNLEFWIGLCAVKAGMKYFKICCQSLIQMKSCSFYY